MRIIVGIRSTIIDMLPFEWLSDEDGLLTFKSEKAARKYLKAKGFTGKDMRRVIFEEIQV